MRPNLIATCLCVFLFAIVIVGKANATGLLNIPAGSLGTALQTLAKDRDFRIDYQPDALQNVHTRGAMGDLTPEEALTRLLSGTGLTYRRLDDHTVTIIGARTAESSDTPSVRKTGFRPSTVEDSNSKFNVSEESPNRLIAQAGFQATSTASAANNESQVSERAPADTGTVEEIIVTAQKRAERIMDVPMSITALSSAAIADRGIVSGDDYLRTIPALSYVDQGPGQNIIVIRGAYGDAFNTGATVGIYFGDVPLSGLALGASTDIKLVDVDRVEVLRGPQGTLYGSNSLSGTIRYIPTAPNLNKAEAHVDAGYSSTSVYGGSNGDAEGILNLPLVNDNLALRVVAYSFQNSGFIKNIAGSAPSLQKSAAFFGASGQAGNQDNIGDSRYYGLRASLLWRPIDNLDVGYTYMYQSDGANDRAFAQRGFPEYERSTYTFGPVVGDGDAMRIDLDVNNLTLNYSLPWGSFHSSTSYVSQYYRRLWDIGVFFPVSGFVPPIPSDSKTHAHDFTEETRFTSDFQGPFQVVAGVYYESSKQPTTQIANYAGSDPTVRPFAPGFGPLYSYFLDRQIDQVAEFGELSYAVFPELKLTAGARHFDYKATFTTNKYQSANTTTMPLSFSTVETDQGGNTFKGGAEYKPTQNTLLYAKYSQGFRLGRPQDVSLVQSLCDKNGDGLIDGTNVSAQDGTIKSDTLNSFEVGTKATLFEGRAALSADVYHNNWNNIPVTYLAPGCTISVVVNGGKARANGSEVEGTLNLLPGLQADFGAGYIDSRLSSTSSLGKSGDLMNYTPKINGHTGLEYKFKGAGQENFVRADYSYYGEYWDMVGEKGNKFGGYGVLDISVGRTFDRVNVRLFANNITNRYAITSDSQYPANGIYPLQPRTVGIKVGVSLY